MRFVTALVLLMPAGWAAAGAGTTQAEFLKIGLSPRAAAMGGAFGAVADDLGAIEYNPAGLSQLNNSQVSAMYVQWIGDVRFASLAGAHVVPFLGTVGVSLNTLDVGGGLLGTSDIQGSLKNFAALGYVIHAAWSRALREDLCVGAGAKILEEDIGDFASSGFAVDGGALYTPIHNVSLALAVLNLGTAAAFEREKDGLPLTVKLAGAWKGLEGEFGQVIASADVNWAPAPRNRFAPAFGVEYWGGRYFAVRAGYALTDTDLSELVGFSAGLGARWQAFRFDLAYAPFSALGQTIRGSVNWEIWPLVTLALPGSSVGEPRSLSGTRVQLPAPPFATAEPGEGGVLLKWEAPQGTGVAGFNVYYKKEGESRFTKYNDEPTLSTTLIIGGLQTNARYFFLVKAVDDAHPPRESAPSPQATAIPY